MEQQQMTTKDALALLDKATSALKLDRTEHTYVLTALQVLQKLEKDYEDATGEIKQLKETIASTATIKDKI